MTPIGEARRHLIDPFTQDGQVSIEHVVVERTQFDLHILSFFHAHDHVPCQLMRMSLRGGLLRVDRPEWDSHQGHE
jgi:hypothetical protein